jgi:hypothetical protein
MSKFSCPFYDLSTFIFEVLGFSFLEGWDVYELY